MMGKAVNSYSAFDISAAGETIEISSSENVHGMKKIRRLTVEQVRALEKSFQLRMILEAGRKEELARALGLHPRQIAIWFQNRRAKWKTTQLEKDFGVLKQNYEFLKIQRSNSIFKNVQNEKDKEVMGVGQIDFNIVKEKKEECYGVPNIPHQASVEEYCGQNVLLALQEEDCYYNMGEMSGFMLVDHWAPSFH